MAERKTGIMHKIIFSKTSFTLIGIVVIALIGTPLYKNLTKQININREIESLDREIISLEKKNTELKGLISYLNSDEFVEEQARLNLNYRKDGEEVLVLKDRTADSGSMNQSETPSRTSLYTVKGLDDSQVVNKKSNIEKWFEYFWN
jgi:cell division protein FtsB